MKILWRVFLPVSALAIVFPFVIPALHLRMNYSNSVPIGIYRTVPGDAPYVGFCLSVATLRTAQRAGLILPSGDCPGSVAPVLKPVFVASAKRPIRFDERGFSVDGNRLPNTAPKPQSRTGAPLTHYPFGLYTTGLWAISSFNPDSFDSRYFGPLDSTAIQFRAKPIWTD